MSEHLALCVLDDEGKILRKCSFDVCWSSETADALGWRYGIKMTEAIADVIEEEVASQLRGAVMELTRGERKGATEG